MNYGQFIRLCPCFVCYDAFYAWLLRQPHETQVMILEMGQDLQDGTAGKIQQTRTEAAHLGFSTSVRGLSQKYAGDELGPLCRGHHREFNDSHHAGTAVFWDKRPALDRDSLLKMLYRIWQSKPVEPSA
jgi:hypothetical protein